MRVEEESSLLSDFASSQRDMNYLEERKNWVGVFATLSYRSDHRKYMNSTSHMKRLNGPLIQ